MVFNKYPVNPRKMDDRPEQRNFNLISTLTSEKRSNSVIKNYRDLNVTPVGPALPPIALFEKKHTFKDKRLSSAMIPDKSLEYTIPSREVKRSSAMGIYNKDAKGNFQPISPLKYHGGGGNPHFGKTEMMETQFSKFSRQTLDSLQPGLADRVDNMG